MLTARAEPSERIRGLELGADDYLAKPFEPRELSLRLANLVRRRPEPCGRRPLRARSSSTFGARRSHGRASPCA